MTHSANVGGSQIPKLASRPADLPVLAGTTKRVTVPNNREGIRQARAKLPPAPDGLQWKSKGAVEAGSKAVVSFKLELGTPKGTPAGAMANAPGSVTSRYKLSSAPDNSSLTVNPQAAPPPMLRAARRGITSEVTPEGGRKFTLEGNQSFKGAAWVNGKLDQLVTDKGQLAQLEKLGFKPDADLQALSVIGDKDSKPTLMLFAADGKSVTTVCSEVGTHSINGSEGGWGGGGGRPAVMRKPVIYLYPTTRTELTVDVKLAGTFTTQYPRTKRDGQWRVFAEPTGLLFDPATERKYGYLFWEGTPNAPFEVDLDQAFCVSRADAEDFLERAAGRFGLSDRERTDFVSYWLPHLEKNKHSVVQFLSDAALERFAHLTVTPSLDTTLRLFMIFKAVDAPVKTGNPNLSLKLRKGSCVVEWGGANLDEQA